jgi:hypothetical protein
VIGLVPIATALRTLFGSGAELPGLVPGLVVRDPAGWQRATALEGPLLDDLLLKAERLWSARPHAAAALAWKAYTYWVSLPAVAGLVSARRVPLLTGDNVWVRLGWENRLLTVGLRAGLPVAVLPADPLAASEDRSVVVVPDEPALLESLRRSLIEEHVDQLAVAIGDRVRLPRRMLLGSLAASVAGTALRLATGDRVGQVERLLDGLELTGLVDLVPGPGGRIRVHRKTCCLAFTLPVPRVCGDCCLRPPKGG